MSIKQANLSGKEPKRFVLRLSEDLFNLLSEEARKEKCSINELILRRILKGMKKKK